MAWPEAYRDESWSDPPLVGWDAAFAHATVGMAFLGVPGYVLERGNPALQRMCGAAWPDLIGAPLLRLLVGLPDSIAPDCLSGDVMQVTLLGAEAAWVRITVSPAGPQQLLVLIEDVTGQKELESQLIHGDRLAHLGGLSATLLHDLSQPLNIMRLTSENALDRLEDEPYSEGERNRQIRTLSGVLDQLKRAQDILDMTWGFGHAPEGDPEPFDPVPVIDSALIRLRERPCAGLVRFDWAPADIGPILLGHGERLEEAIFQLILNACETLHTLQVRQGPAAREGVVTVRCAVDPGQQVLVLSVSDNGPGLSPALLRRLNQPALSANPLGKGLGLVVAFGIVSELGGRIDVTSTPFGATFTILLPLECGEEALTPPCEVESEQ